MLAYMKGGNLAKKSVRLGGLIKKIGADSTKFYRGNSVRIPKGTDDTPLKTKESGPFLKGVFHTVAVYEQSGR
jgi:hypothetical protein